MDITTDTEHSVGFIGGWVVENQAIKGFLAQHGAMKTDYIIINRKDVSIGGNSKKVTIKIL